jgi:uncharacterized protein YkwD
LKTHLLRAPLDRACGSAYRAPAARMSRADAQLRAQVLAELNRARASGRYCGNVYFNAPAALRADLLLDQAAQLHCEDMARNETLDHVSQGGQSPFDRIRAAGYSFRAAAENIASGNPGVYETVQQLLNSPGHCQNMMSALYVHLGVGYARSLRGEHYWTLDFATPW